MKKLTVLIAALIFALCNIGMAAENPGLISKNMAGSALLTPIIETLPTDAAATISTVVYTRGFAGLRGMVKCDKAGTLIVYPLHDVDDRTERGEASDTLTVSANTATEWGYSQIGAYSAEVVFLKTEAGDSSRFKLVINGTLQN